MAGPDSDVQKEWDEWMPQLLNDIQAGYFDAHLRPVARALFARREALTGTEHVVSDEAGSDEAGVVSCPDCGMKFKAALALDTHMAQKHTLLPAQQLVAHHSVRPVSPQYDPKDSFEVPQGFPYGGKRYRRADLIGGLVTLPSGVLTDTKLTGTVVRITGLGEKKVKIEFTNPAILTGTMKKWHDSGRGYFAPYSLLREVLS